MTTDDTPASAEDARFAALLASAGEPGRHVPYGDRPDQHVEWFGERATASTVIAFIHGGYFRQRTTLAHARPLARALVARGSVPERAHASRSATTGPAGAQAPGTSGVAVALIEYRRAGGEGGHPHTLADIETAIAAIIGESSESAEGTLKPGSAVRFVVTGHSAGGSLALSWASRQPAAGPQVRVRPLAPVTDLVAEVRDGLGDGAVLEYMGARPEEDRARYLSEDPRSRAALIPDRCDVRIVHGIADQTVDIAFSRGFPAPRQELIGADHFDVIDPRSPHFDTVAGALLGP